MSNQVHSTHFIGKQLIRFTEIASTNQVAKQYIANNEPSHGAVILTDFQTNGRGQARNSWYSPSGRNLLTSIILQPSQAKILDQFLFNMMISVSIAETVEHFVQSENVEIKWPNDILINGQKTCGILIETMLRQEFVSHFIVGIGLNVNQLHFRTDLTNATSLKIASGIDFNLQTVLEELCLTIEKWYNLFEQKKFGELKRAYFSKLFRYQETHYFKINGQQVLGEIIGVNDFGQLQVKINNQLVSFGNKEIEFVY